MQTPNNFRGPGPQLQPYAVPPTPQVRVSEPVVVYAPAPPVKAAPAPATAAPSLPQVLARHGLPDAISLQQRLHQQGYDLKKL